MTKLVKQKGNWDCVLACIAMWKDVTYHHVYYTFKHFYPKYDEFKGITDKIQIRLLKNMYEVNPCVAKGAMFGCPGIVSLPSLNDEDGLHACYWDGRMVFDPNYKHRSKAYYPKRFELPDDVEIMMDYAHFGTVLAYKTAGKQIRRV